MSDNTAKPEDKTEEKPAWVNNFTHLHLHTSYSLLDGAARIKDLVKKAKELKMPAVAITDHGNMHGVIEFYKKMKAADIKPILGVEIYVAENDMESRQEKRNYHLVLLAENNKGYENLCYLVAMANMKGFYRKPRIDHKLLSEHHEGLIALSACLSGEIPAAIRSGRPDKAREIAAEYNEIMGDGNFYLEIQMNGIPAQDAVNRELVKIASDLSIPLIATNDVHYVEADHYDLHDTLLCIGYGKLKDDPSRHRYDTNTLYLRPAEEMQELFAEYPEAIENTIKVAERCNVELVLGEPKLPKFEVPEGYDQNSWFEKVTWDGFEERLLKFSYEYDRAEYEKRLKYEIGIIKDMDFSGYFLIVADFIRFAKEEAIPVGPGRGSGVGSLVAYSLKITDLDPLPYDLIFERFLNPDRVSMPDFDIDFCMNRRDEVFNYVSEKYGKNNVGQIATFGALKARGVVRDVCKVFDIPLAEADVLSKLIPEGPYVTLDSALEDEPRLGNALESNFAYQKMFETAKGLEGLHKFTGIHAAGVVISDKPLWHITPLMVSDGTLVSQYAKDEVEDVGLVKFDFLGLKTLTVIDEAVKLVNVNRSDDDQLILENIPLTDEDTYKLISSGETNGVFQMESSGFQAMLKGLKPEKFEDIILAVAAYRPGPMKNIPACVARKHGREELKLTHEVLRPILADTYGIMIYQEQLMQIAAEMGGFSMGQADILRKGMAKKKADVMEKMLGKLRVGAMEKGYSKEVMDQVISDMEDFASYGFNKSHAAAYGLISYQTAYLKTHHPLEFLAATLTCDMENTDKVVKFVQEAKRVGIEVLPPSVLKSEHVFTVEGKKIRFGMGAVKGIGKKAIEAIIKARVENPFKSIYEFCENVDLGSVNKKNIEGLIKSGAFDFTDISRSKMMVVLVKAVEGGHNKRKERESGQTNLMDFFKNAADSDDSKTGIMEDYPEISDWTEKEKLTYEAESMGIYLSSHPMDRYQDEVKRYTRASLSDVEKMAAKEEVTLAGVISSSKEIMLKSGKGRMAFFNLQDTLGSIECVVFQRAYESCADVLKVTDPVLVYGNVMIDGKGDESVVKVSVSKIIPLMDVMKSRSKKVHFYAPEFVNREQMQKVSEILEKFVGKCPVLCHVKKEGQYEVIIQLPQKWCVDPSGEMLDTIETVIGKNSVVLE